MRISADKGGGGKTASAVHLGSYLTRDRRTLVLASDTKESAIDASLSGLRPTGINFSVKRCST